MKITARTLYILRKGTNTYRVSCKHKAAQMMLDGFELVCMAWGGV